jgi:hypothetical protein
MLNIGEPKGKRPLGKFRHRWEDNIKTDLNPLKPKLVEIIFKNSVRTAKKTLHFTITKISWLTLFKEIIAICSENHTKPIRTKCRIVVKAGGVYRYQWALKG